ncbi:MAG TPA: tetratricopeptide repeat protein [Candidatus Acidoferrum sp.]|nr:tetratricopeptide repeat protein [Candidatus Acidoferrum sp.]
MVRSRVVASCFLMFTAFPSAGSAQSKSKNSYTVSVHELSIPDGALAAFNKGIRLLAAQDQARSIGEFRRAIKKFPRYYEAYDKMGIAEVELKRDDEAEQAFRRAIELSGGRYAEPHFALGVILCDDHKNFAEAETVIRDGLNIDPTDAAGHFALAWLLYTTNRLPEAEASARDSIFYAPNSPLPYALLAEIHLRENNRPALVQDLDTYLKLDPNGSFRAKALAARADAERVLAQRTSASLPPQ